jgi:hypothetical protein
VFLAIIGGFLSIALLDKLIFEDPCSSNVRWNDMTFKVEKYVRKSFPVDCVQVTAENMSAVARWCNGDIRTTTPRNPAEAKNYIYLDVPKARDDRHQRAYIGDWVLRMHNGFKFYNDRAFKEAFELPEVREVPSTENIVRQTNSGSGFFATVLSPDEREALKLVTAFSKTLTEIAGASERAS